MHLLPSPQAMLKSLAGPARLLGILAAALIVQGQAAPASSASSPAARHVVTSNPHLHSTDNASKPPAPGPRTSTITIHVLPPVNVGHTTWTPQHDTRSYIALHRGLGTIHGTTHDAAGKPVPNVRVALQHPGGKPFANAALKHVTHSAANGAFTMTNVRPGTYRVYASIKPATAKLKKAFVRTTVHANTSETLSVKI